MKADRKESALECTQIANYLIDNCDPIECRLTNLKLNKVIYFLHGYCLARFDRPLVRNHFETWDYGPVVGSLYHMLKRYGNEPVGEKILYVNYETGKSEAVDYSDVSREFGDSLDRVSKNLISFDVWELVRRTHAEGGAWDEIRRKQSGPQRSTRIPDSLIAEHYRNLVGGKSLH
jgi:uncharacterized phage-associated protein